MIREIAPAKVNLFLHVGQKRADGYHDLESLVVFADVGDELGFEDASDLTLEIKGPFAKELESETDNLVLRAARKFAEFTQIEPQLKVTLIKNLPVASGIGGGSSDAGAVLRGFSRRWPKRLNLPQLWNLGSVLGSDVPVSVLPGCWWMSGRGERFASVDNFPVLDAVLANAGKPVSTAAVYDALTLRHGIGAVKRPPPMTMIAELHSYLRSTANDLEGPARAICPEIGLCVDSLKRHNAVIARMSGSGGTCFGIYPDEAQARRAADMIAAEHPGWWVTATKLNRARIWNFQ